MHVAHVHPFAKVLLWDLEHAQGEVRGWISHQGLRAAHGTRKGWADGLQPRLQQNAFDDGELCLCRMKEVQPGPHVLSSWDFRKILGLLRMLKDTWDFIYVC